jgi:hypothetical protein
MLKSNFPDHKFEYQHYSTEYIINVRDTATDENSAKKGAESDKERWGINHAMYVKGKTTSFTDDTLRGTTLYPDYQVLAKPEVTLADPKFVFESPKIKVENKRDNNV